MQFERCYLCNSRHAYTIQATIDNQLVWVCEESYRKYLNETFSGKNEMRLYKIKYFDKKRHDSYLVLIVAKNALEAVKTFTERKEEFNSDGWLDIEFLETVREET